MSMFYQNKTPSIKIGFSIVLYVGLLMHSSLAYSQTEAVQIQQIDTLSLKFEKPGVEPDSSGLVKRILQMFKFRENRNLKEKDRFYDYLDSLVTDGDLSVDTLDLNNALLQIEEILKNDSILLGQNRYSIDSLGEISSSEIDSLKVDLGKLLRELEVKYDLEIRKLNDTISVSLKDLREVKYSFGNKDKTPFETRYDDGKETIFKPYLRPKQGYKIIGWHNPWTRSAYKNYNYNYLTAVNLYGYELAANGGLRNDKDFDKFFEPNGVVAYAKANNCPVYLTVYSKSNWEIATFLNNTKAKKHLLKEVDSILKLDYGIRGVNIFFENIKEQDQNVFSEFICDLKDVVYTNGNMELLLTIPSIYEKNSLDHISGYNFKDLNKEVTNYIVMTERMSGPDNRYPQSSSPLLSSDFTRGSIESTINFYANGKIPLSKLIVAVSYCGLEWSNIEKNTVKNGRSINSIKYSEILDSYIKNRSLKAKIFGKNYDSIQASARITVKNSDGTENQIWYENAKSLRQKYNWALQNDIGGISIRGLGYDDGYPELWDVMGTTLIEIDTFTKLTPSIPLNVPRKVCKYESFNVDSLNTKIGLKRLYKSYKDTTYDDKASIWYKYQRYHFTEKEDDSNGQSNILEAMEKKVKSFMDRYKLYSDYKWASEDQTHYITDYGKKLKNNENNTVDLEDEETCKCLYERLIIFSNISFYIAGIFLAIVSLLYFRLTYLDRLNKGGSFQRISIKVIGLISVLLMAGFTFYGLYMTPKFHEFGASNQGEVGLKVFLVIIVLGILLGVYISHSISKGRYLRKNLP